MKKIIVWIVGGLVVAAVVALVVIYVLMGRIIEKAIETGGPMVTKSPVTVGRVDFRPLRGKLRIVDFAIGNPEGFKTPNAFAVGEIRISMVPGSVFSELVQVQEVYIGNPEITYEMGLGKTNIGTLLDNVNAFTGSTTDPEGGEKPKPAEEPAGGKTRRITVDLVKVENGQINLSGTLLQGGAVPVALPTIEMRDIGKSDPVTAGQAAAEIIHRICGGVLDAVKQSGKAMVDAAKGVGEDLKRGLGGAADSVKGLFKKGD